MSALTETRSAGILLHPTSLPSRFGIGDLGPGAFAFLDWLRAAGLSLWQVLPVGPTGLGNSPYTSLSAFAGNPLLISPELLVEDGLLPVSALAGAPAFPTAHVDFGAVVSWKTGLLNRAAASVLDPAAGQNPALRRMRARFEAFRADRAQAPWLEDWGLFSALKSRAGGREWTAWDPALRRRDPAALSEARGALAADIDRHALVQCLFARQWERLRDAARDRGVRIIGDLPIYVAHDSADVWAHARLFNLDDAGQPVTVAGVPPDYFSATGQRWGNPIYRWQVALGEGCHWWIDRIRANLALADLVRVDHFRAFAGFWEIPSAETTAVKGRWVPGPGMPLFDALRGALGDDAVHRLIAEDLGHITDDVKALRDRLGLPGMRVLQFALGDADNDHRPDRHAERCVVYTGTHDNDTARGWFESLAPRDRKQARRLFHSRDANIPWNMIRTAFGSVAGAAIVPMQDALGLDSNARMNTPGSPSDNWSWRVLPKQLRPELARRLKSLARTTGRLHPARA